MIAFLRDQIAIIPARQAPQVEPQEQAPRRGRPAGRSERRNENERGIVAAYDLLAPTWKGTRDELYAEVLRDAGLAIPPGYTGAAVRVGKALRSRKDGVI